MDVFNDSIGPQLVKNLDFSKINVQHNCIYEEFYELNTSEAPAVKVKNLGVTMANDFIDIRCEYFEDILVHSFIPSESYRVRL